MSTLKINSITHLSNSGTENISLTNDGKVGIGIASPVTSLHCAKSGSGGVFALFTNDTSGHGSGNGTEIGIGGDEQSQIWNFENTYFRLATNNTERLRITSAGNVGIGTTSPSKLVEIYKNGLASVKIKGDAAGGLGAELILQNADTAANGYTEIQFQDAGTNVFSKIRGFNLTDGSNNGYLSFYTSSATSGLGERVRIDSVGSVHIDGSTSANHGLRFTPGGWNGYDNRMGFCGTSGADFWWSSNWNPTDGARDHSGYATNYIRQNISTGYISFGTGGVNASASERLRINLSGALGLGGATYGSSGQVLTSAGSGGVPTWTTISAVVREATGTRNTAGPATAGDALTANAQDNTLYGYDAGTALEDGDNNVAVGAYSLIGAVDSSQNTALGSNCMTGAVTGINNVAVGFFALKDTTSGAENVALGFSALQDHTDGDANIAVGRSALENMAAGDNNVAIGRYAGQNATNISKAVLIGYEAGKALVDGTNIAIGDRALSIATGVAARSNIAIGYRAMTDIAGYSNIGIGGDCCGGGATASGAGAYYNVAIGDNALEDLTTADNCTCIGVAAGKDITTASNNTAVGYHALETVSVTGTDNVAVGKEALKNCTVGYKNVGVGGNACDDISTGERNTCVGASAGNYIQTGFDNVFIGRDTTAAAEGDDGAVVVGANIGSKGSYKAFIGGSSGIYNEQNYASFSTTSDRRIKKNITNNTTGLDKINQITIRNFEYKKFKKDSDGIYLKDSFKKDSDGVYLKDSFKKDSDGVYLKDSDGKYIPETPNGNYIPETPNGKYIPETADDEITWSEFNGGNTQSDSIIVKKTGTQVGVIAQELESVLPGLVETDAKHGLKSVNTDNLIWYLVNAVKELSTKIDALEAG